MMYIKFDDKSIYASIANIFYYEGAKAVSLAETDLKLEDIKKKDLFYADENGEHKISDFDDDKRYVVDSKKDENCYYEQVEGITEGEPVVRRYKYVKKEKSVGEAEKKKSKLNTESIVRYMKDKDKGDIKGFSAERLAAIESGKVELTEKEKKAFLNDKVYKLTEEFFDEYQEKLSSEEKIVTTVTKQRIDADPYMTINVRDAVDGTPKTVNANAVYIEVVEKKGKVVTKEVKSIAEILKDKRTGYLLGQKAKLKVGDAFVELEPLTREDIRTLNKTEKVVKVTEYDYSADGEYAQITLTTSQAEIVKITDLWYGDIQLKNAEDLQKYVGKSLLYKNGDKSISTKPITYKQAFGTYNTTTHMEEASTEYVETDAEHPRYLLTKDGTFVDERNVRPLCYDKTEDETTCDAYLVTNKEGKQFVVSKKDMTPDLKKSYESVAPVEPLKLSTKDFKDVYVIQTSNNVADGVEHSCSVVGKITDAAEKEKAINKAQVEFLRLYTTNKYDVHSVVIGEGDEKKIVELDPEHKRYAESKGEMVARNVSVGNHQYMKPGTVTIKNGKFTGGPTMDVMKKAGKFFKDSSKIALGLAGLCISPVGFLLSPIILTSAAVTFAVGVVGSLSMMIKYGISNGLFKDRTKLQRRDFKRRNKKEIKALLKMAKEASTEAEKTKIMATINSKYEQMLSECEILEATQMGQGIDVVDGKCQVNSDNAYAFKMYKKAYKAKLKELKKAAKSKDNAKYEQVKAEFDAMTKDYHNVQTAPADKKAAAYKEFLNNCWKYTLHVASLAEKGPTAKAEAKKYAKAEAKIAKAKAKKEASVSKETKAKAKLEAKEKKEADKKDKEEVKVAYKCKIRFRKMKITYKHEDINKKETEAVAEVAKPVATDKTSDEIVVKRDKAVDGKRNVVSNLVHNLKSGIDNKFH
ncbi:MAG: hypothetical protein MJ152_02540, partial [Clostridia bacterium]|nr:hypothetical protein [Clostridia bacterium]